MKIVSQKKPVIGSSRARGRKAFSLIEVTIAVAITAVALVSLMGMLPQGMKTMALAGDKAIEARIHQQIVGEVMLTEWEERNYFDKQIRGYDDQGIHIRTDSTMLVTGRTADDVIYTSRVRVPPDSVVLPGGVIDPELQLVIIEITNQADATFDFDSAANEPKIATYQSVIVKMSQNL